MCTVAANAEESEIENMMKEGAVMAEMHASSEGEWRYGAWRTTILSPAFSAYPMPPVQRDIVRPNSIN